MKKMDARKYGQKQRSLIPFSQRKQRSHALFLKLVPYMEKANVIGCYVSMKDEVDTFEILAWCFENHKHVCVPKVTGNTLVFYYISSFSELQEGAFHVLEPCSQNKADLKDIDFMIVPLSSYDLSFHRCGYGKGYYDSILRECRYKAGIAFHEQCVDGIEVEPFDVSLDYVISC